MILRRVVWKRPPTELEVRQMLLATIFGPYCFERGNEWLFLGKPFESAIPPPAPEGYRLLDGNPFSPTPERTLK